MKITWAFQVLTLSPAGCRRKTSDKIVLIITGYFRWCACLVIIGTYSGQNGGAFCIHDLTLSTASMEGFSLLVEAIQRVPSRLEVGKSTLGRADMPAVQYYVVVSDQPGPTI